MTFDRDIIESEVGRVDISTNNKAVRFRMIEAGRGAGEFKKKKK